MINLDMNENRYSQEIQLPYNEYQKFYPRSKECDLRNLISDIHRVDSEKIYILNGIDEGIWLFLKHIQQYGVELYIDIPNYCGVLEGIKALDIKTVNNYHRDYYDVASTIRFLKECSDKVKAAYFCSPINPLGISIDRLREIIEICRKKQILVFLDQAYIEFCKFDVPLYECLKFDNLIIARTFSKAYGLAGIRCGYVVTGNAKFKQLLTELKTIQPYQLSTYTLSCAIKALQEHDRIREAITKIENEKQNLYLLFEELHIKYLKTETNFVLMYLGSFVSEFIQYSLNHGVVVVSTEHFGLSGYVRVSIGNAEDMNEFTDIVKKYWSILR